MTDVPVCADCKSTTLYARGRCNRCYLRHRRAQMKAGGYELALVRGRPLERLMSRTEPGPDGCILYTGTLSNRGYGQISVDGHRMLAHRAAYELTVGPIPPGLALDHTCHNGDPSCLGGPSCLHRRCINVLHLEPVTKPENTRRGKGWMTNGTKTHCPQGHPYDETNTNLYDGRRYCRACCNSRRRRTRADDSYRGGAR